MGVSSTTLFEKDIVELCQLWFLADLELKPGVGIKLGQNSNSARNTELERLKGIFMFRE